MLLRELLFRKGVFHQTWHKTANYLSDVLLIHSTLGAASLWVPTRSRSLTPYTCFTTLVIAALSWLAKKHLCSASAFRLIPAMPPLDLESKFSSERLAWAAYCMLSFYKPVVDLGMLLLKSTLLSKRKVNGHSFGGHVQSNMELLQRLLQDEDTFNSTFANSKSMSTVCMYSSQNANIGNQDGRFQTAPSQSSTHVWCRDSNPVNPKKGRW